jgi:hypothetical protein
MPTASAAIGALTAPLVPTGRVPSAAQRAAEAKAAAEAAAGGPAVRPMGGAQRRTVWREEKRQRTYSVTDTAWALNTALAEAYDMNRSEVLEVLMRHAHTTGLDLAAIRSTLVATTNATARTYSAR